MRALNEALEKRGVHMRMSRDGQAKARDVVFEYRSTYDRRDGRGNRIRVSAIRGHRLGRGFSIAGIQHALGVGMAMYRMAERAMDDGNGNDM